MSGNHSAEQVARTVRRIKRATVWRIEGWLLGWVENAEAVNDPEGVLLGEDEGGDFMQPRGLVNGEAYWHGWWHWWNPTHWPAYIRSRRRNAYVMIERDTDE